MPRCAQTAADRAAMPTVEKTMVLYPKSGWRLKQGMTSEMIPKKGNAIDVDLGVAEEPDDRSPHTRWCENCAGSGR